MSIFKKGIRGFTLIELLVVIAIIGILSSIVLASLNTARAKSRDARRLSDLKEIATAIQLYDNGSGTRALATCTAAGVAAYTCTAPDLSKFLDPSVAAGGTVCTTGSTVVCQYAIGKGTLATAAADTGTFEVCAYLETGPPPLAGSGGMVRIDNTGTILSGCN